MRDGVVDPALVRAWLTGRSVARGLPAPVLDRGGLRVDVHSELEVRRWVFPQPCAGLAKLGREIIAPLNLLKLCGSGAELLSALPDRWRLDAPGFFMTATEDWAERPLPTGYVLKVEHRGVVTEVRVMSAAGELAASGSAAEADEAFVYDRIITTPAHQRRGLGRVVMTALRRARRNLDAPQLLTATEDGRALYSSLGWRVLSPFSTASIPV